MSKTIMGFMRDERRSIKKYISLQSLVMRSSVWVVKKTFNVSLRYLNSYSREISSYINNEDWPSSNGGQHETGVGPTPGVPLNAKPGETGPDDPVVMQIIS